MRSRTTANFRRCLGSLPPEIRAAARKAYKHFSENPGYPSLRFKKVHATEPIYSARVTAGYRALCVIDLDKVPGTMLAESVAIWFWIGSHADYDKQI
jgi:hypothetical protein